MRAKKNMAVKESFNLGECQVFSELSGMFPDTPEAQAGGVWTPSTVTVAAGKTIRSNLELLLLRKNNKKEEKIMI